MADLRKAKGYKSDIETSNKKVPMKKDEDVGFDLPSNTQQQFADEVKNVQNDVVYDNVEFSSTLAKTFKNDELAMTKISVHNQTSNARPLSVVENQTLPSYRDFNDDKTLISGREFNNQTKMQINETM